MRNKLESTFHQCQSFIYFLFLFAFSIIKNLQFFFKWQNWTWPFFCSLADLSHSKFNFNIILSHFSFQVSKSKQISIRFRSKMRQNFIVVSIHDTIGLRKQKRSISVSLKKFNDDHHTINNIPFIKWMKLIYECASEIILRAKVLFESFLKNIEYEFHCILTGLWYLIVVILKMYNKIIMSVWFTVDVCIIEVTRQ